MKKGFKTTQRYAHKVMEMTTRSIPTKRTEVKSDSLSPFHLFNICQMFYKALTMNAASTCSSTSFLSDHVISPYGFLSK